MSVDQYKLCPCGNGKKLKFCKCVDQPQEYEKISRMMEADQGLAALDRINQLLAKTPNTAWLLALKCEISLGLNEEATFRETALRFLKLKPDNPLALIFRSIVACMDEEPLDMAARYLLEGLAEYRETIHPLVIGALNTLTVNMFRRGKGAYCSFWEDILAGLAESAELKYEPSSSESDVNLLVKSPNIIVADPPNSPWMERLHEVVSLAQTFRYAQAETKLRSILRDYPDQPGPLSNLLRAQIILLDEQGAINTARKLASLSVLPQETRDYYCGLSIELDCSGNRQDNKFLSKYCEIGSLDEVAERLEALGITDNVESTFSAAMRGYFAHSVNDEVAAQRMLDIYSRPGFADVDSEQEPPRMVGNVLLFGKQTDKPARALVMIFQYPGYEDIFGQVVGALCSVRDLEDPSPRTYPYTTFLQITYGETQNNLYRAKFPQQASDALVDTFLNMPLEMLGGDSPLQAVQDENKRGFVRGLLAHFEGCQFILVADDMIDQLYQRLGFDRPNVTPSTSDANLRINNPLDIERIDVRNLPDGQVAGMLVHAAELGATRVAVRAAKECLQRRAFDDNYHLRVRAITTYLSTALMPEKALALMEDLQNSLAKLNRPLGHVVLQRVNMLVMAQRHEESQQILLKAFADHPSDPYLLNFYQHVLQNQNQPADLDRFTGQQLQMRQTRTRADAISSAAPPPSGLVLPGAEPASASATKSKLWLPGS